MHILNPYLYIHPLQFRVDTEEMKFFSFRTVLGQCSHSDPGADQVVQDSEGKSR